MNTILKNDSITLEISEHGAEPVSLRSHGNEYLWTAAPEFWKRHAPILFPIVGQVFEGNYRTPEGEYHLSQHGFARDMDFSSDGNGNFTLCSDERTRELYPYDFKLVAQYELQGNTVIIRWTVTNPSDKTIHFQIGAHPAFNMPDFNPDDEIHGYIRYFDSKGNEVNPLPYTHISHGYRAVTQSPEPVVSPMALRKETFDGDAFLFEKSQVLTTILYSKDNTPVLRVDSESPALGIWSPPGKNAPFVCIEPWMGITDMEGYTGPFSEKDLVIALAPGASHEFRYDITVL